MKTKFFGPRCFNKLRDNFRVYLERAHPAFLTTLVVLVYILAPMLCKIRSTKTFYEC